MPITSQYMDFQRHMKLSYVCAMFWGERWEVVVRFVDSVRIVYRHCLNFLFRKYKRDRKDIPGNVPTIAKDLKTHTEYQEKYISTKVAGFNML